MKTIFKAILILFVISCIICQDVKDSDFESKMFSEFEEFVQTYKKVYPSLAEFSYRLGVFTENYRTALAHSQESESTGDSDAQFGITEYFDLTPSEFQQQFLGLNA